MKNTLTKNGNVICKSDSLNKTSFALIAVTLLASQNVFANRPAMQDSGAASSHAQAMTNTEQDANEGRPTMPSNEVQAPSSVELMMQNQSQHTTGNVLQLPASEIQAGETLKIKLLDYPRRGMSMSKVQHEYGEPNNISDSVGKPPITSWTYSDRIVYFEFTTVLHVVAR